MKVVDLFSGLGGWSQAFLDRGHDVARYDWDKQFEKIPNTIIADVTMLNPEQFKPDVVLLAPDCGRFSVTNIGRNWTENHEPRNEEAKKNLGNWYKPVCDL